MPVKRGLAEDEKTFPPAKRHTLPEGSAQLSFRPGLFDECAVEEKRRGYIESKP